MFDMEKINDPDFKSKVKSLVMSSQADGVRVAISVINNIWAATDNEDQRKILDVTKIALNELIESIDPEFTNKER